MFVQLNDPAVQAALISAIGEIISTTLAAICAAAIGKLIAGRKKLAANLEVAINDIAFLLAIEELHCQEKKNLGLGSRKIKIRDLARERGQNWSGRFTAGRIALEKAGRKLDES